MAFIKSCSIDSRNEQNPTCEVVHETKLTHFRNLLPNRFLPSSVSTALAWRSRDLGFNPHWGQFLMNFFCSSLCEDLSDNLTETPIVKNSNGICGALLTPLVRKGFRRGNFWLNTQVPSKMHEQLSQHQKERIFTRSWIEICFRHYFVFWAWISSVITRAWLYKGVKDSDRQKST